MSAGQFTFTGARCRSTEEARQSVAALAVGQMRAQMQVPTCTCVYTVRERERERETKLSREKAF